MCRITRCAVMLLLLGAGCGQEDGSEVTVPITAESAPVVDSEKPLAVEQADALTMFEAAGKAFTAGQIEDAGFYFYAAQCRKRVDLRVYVSVATPGNTPDILLGAMNMQIGSYVNPTIMRDRDAFARAIDRLTAWKPVFDDTYSPGWEYKSEPSRAEFDAAVNQWKAINVKPLRGIANLLADDEYYRLFCTTQDYNLKGTGILEKAAANTDLPQPNPTVTEKTYRAALERLAQIEEQRGDGFGIFSKKLQPKREPPPEYVIEDGKVLHTGRVMKNVDAASFEILDQPRFAKDREHVYVGGHVIVGADPATFRVLEGPYGRDSAHVFCGTVRVDVRDADRFEVVRSSDFWHQISDSEWLVTWYGETLAEVEVSEQHPAITADAWGRDDVSYFFGPARVAGADYDSFQVIDESNARDKNREYHGATPTADTTQ